MVEVVRHVSALGPEVVSLDEVDLASGLALETRVNGEVMQSANTSELVFDVPALIAWISQGLTLDPGDLILTGTPGGVGTARTPRAGSPTATSWRSRSAASAPSETRSCAGRRLFPGPAHGTRRVIA